MNRAKARRNRDRKNTEDAWRLFWEKQPPQVCPICKEECRRPFHTVAEFYAAMLPVQKHQNSTFQKTQTNVN